jgi:hypothetical protein
MACSDSRFIFAVQGEHSAGVVPSRGSRAAARDALQDATLVFATSGDSNVFWPSIVEKACVSRRLRPLMFCNMMRSYAKLHGSYAMLQGGSVADALVDLTGAASAASSGARHACCSLKCSQVVSL